MNRSNNNGSNQQTVVRKKAIQNAAKVYLSEDLRIPMVIIKKIYSTLLRNT